MNGTALNCNIYSVPKPDLTIPVSAKITPPMAIAQTCRDGNRYIEALRNPIATVPVLISLLPQARRDSEIRPLSKESRS